VTIEKLVLVFDEYKKRKEAKPYKVSGYVYSTLQQVLANVGTVAMNVNLLGSGIYDTAETLTELNDNGGFDKLGDALTDTLGFYAISFDNAQYRQTQSGLADVVVYAVAGDKIVGRTALATKSSYTGKQLQNQDITLTDPSIKAASEYESLVKAINPLLENSKLSLFQLYGSAKQLQFLSTQTGQSLQNITLLVQAANISKDNDKLNLELLYGVGRQTNNSIDLGSLALLPDTVIQQYVNSSITQNLVGVRSADAITNFVNTLHNASVAYAAAGGSDATGSPVGRMLQIALNDTAIQSSFLSAAKNYTGTPQDFWTTFLPSQPDFKDNPGAVASLLLCSQLSAVTSSNLALVGQIKNAGVADITGLLSWTDEQWATAITSSGGVPPAPAASTTGQQIAQFPQAIQDIMPSAITLPGETPSPVLSTDQQVAQYAKTIQNALNMAFPTQKVSAMLNGQELKFADPDLAPMISQFIANTPAFDFRTSRITDFADDINKNISTNYQAEATSQLQLLQRLFQVSPTSDAMTVLLNAGYQSALHIASVPASVFVATYSASLGSDVAQAVHDRAAFMARRSEGTAVKFMDYLKNASPVYIINSSMRAAVGASLSDPTNPANVPDYASLFGSPDMCACQDCLSVLSPAAYFVDLLRFLQRSVDTSTGNSVFTILNKRRPDVQYLQLTCENSYTPIPYIDLVNEVMEYYVANGDSSPIPPYNTGDTTQAELSAQPQNTLMAAYSTLAQAVYPFSLPYHQPLDVIRTYLGNLNITRLQLMQIFGNATGSLAVNAQAAEQLGLSPEQYGIITGLQLDGVTPFAPPAVPLGYYGYTAGTLATNTAGLVQVSEFLTRTGIQYTDLINLLTTQFINPGQNALNVLQALFANVSNLDPNTWYTELSSGTWDTDTIFTGALAANNISDGYFLGFLAENLTSLQTLVTLYVPDTTNPCDLSIASLKLIQDIYQGTTSTAIMDTVLNNLNQFIRLWNVTGYTTQQLDILITALNTVAGTTGITPGLIENIALVQQINSAPQLPLQQLCCIWADIDTFGSSSTYTTLFLSKAQNIDPAFVPDALGGYFTSAVTVPAGVTFDMASHIPTILSAYQLNAGDYNAIATDLTASVNLSTALLTIENLSLVYGYVVLADLLGLSITDLITLKQVFDIDPFASPANTLQLINYAAQVTNSGFQPDVMAYIFCGGSTIAPLATFGLSSNTINTCLAGTAAAIAAVDQNYPDSDMLSPTEAMLRQGMSLIYSQAVTEQLIAMLKGAITYQVQLAVPYPAAITVPNPSSSFTEQLSYDPAQGLLICTGVLQDADKDAWLTAYAGITPMLNAVNAIYTQPESFISTNFSGIFGTDFTAANQTLLNHPAQPSAPQLPQQYQWFYSAFLPFLKNQLKQSAIVSGVAAITGLDALSTGILINDDLPNLLTWLSASGLTASYFNNSAFTIPALFTETDTDFSFDWTRGDPSNNPPPVTDTISSSPFSVSWKGWICPSVTDDYVFIADLLNCTSFSLLVNNVQVISSPTAQALPVHLVAGTLYCVTIQGVFTTGSSFAFSWQTTTLPKQIVPASVLFPKAEAADFTSKVTSYFASALFITGFALTPDELSYFILFSSDFDNINFNELGIGQWQQMAAYTGVRNSLPLQLATLIQVFKQARLAQLSDLITTIVYATGWDSAQLTSLISSFNLTEADFVNQAALIQLQNAINLANTCGLDAALLTPWAAVPTQPDFDSFYQIALDIQSAVKSKYDDDTWPTVGAQLSNTLRQDQEAALISYLLVQQFPAWSQAIQDADSLYEYFLIDVQMTACMDTSRMVQAIAAAQLMVSRCLMGLEIVNGLGPAAIDTDQWSWMQSYSVWGSAREVFLYPEDYLLEPYRDDQSPLFQTFQSNLLQNDITSATAETAYRTYLDGLSEIANLEVCGTYQDNIAQRIHTFARTHSAPYRYYYRYFDINANQWWPWQKLTVDIRAQDDSDSSSSGVHLIPVVWENRLFLFWPEFTLKHQSSSISQSNTTFTTIGKDHGPNDVASIPYYEIRLAWSEYKDGDWTAKQLSKEFLQHFAIVGSLQQQLKYYQFWPLPLGGTLAIAALIYIEESPYQSYLIGYFSTQDIQMPFKITSSALELGQFTPAPFFMSSSRTDDLNINGNQYFEDPITYQLLSTFLVDNDMGANFSHPFFFTDLNKPYFVTPALNVVFNVRYPSFNAIASTLNQPLRRRLTGVLLQASTANFILIVLYRLIKTA
jgi:hypothetical protein